MIALDANSCKRLIVSAPAKPPIKFVGTWITKPGHTLPDICLSRGNTIPMRIGL
jgi:hypothetical protein